MGKAFIIQGIDASGVAIKQVTPLSKMTDITSSLIFHNGYMFLEYSPVNVNTLRPLDSQSSIVLDVSAYQGQKIILYIPKAATTPDAYWRCWAQSFASPITANDWSSVTSIKQNAVVPSAIDPYIGGENADTSFVYKEVEVPSDANYLICSFSEDGNVGSQIRVYV